jgi:hypothetical protein
MFAKSLLLLGLAAAAGAAPGAPAEMHKLHVHGAVSYRCYAGYSGKVVSDARSGERCDNQSTTKVLIDRVVTINLKDEPDPDNSPDLEGSWSEVVSFKGRKFTAAVSLFKSAGALPYTLTVIGHDDEPSPRQSTVRTQMRTPADMNPVLVEYGSRGKKEEIQFDLKVEAAR